MVASAYHEAAIKAYTLIQIPIIDFMYGDTDDNIQNMCRNSKIIN